MKKRYIILIVTLIILGVGGFWAFKLFFPAMLPTVLNSESRGRDAARIGDLNSIIAALEAYNLDNGFYPKNKDSGCISGKDDVFGADTSKYFSGGKTPLDPSGPRSGAIGECAKAGQYMYRYFGKPSVGEYILVTEMENKNQNNTIRTDNPYIRDPKTDCNENCDYFVLVK